MKTRDRKVVSLAESYDVVLRFGATWNEISNFLQLVRKRFKRWGRTGWVERGGCSEPSKGAIYFAEGEPGLRGRSIPADGAEEYIYTVQRSGP